MNFSLTCVKVKEVDDNQVMLCVLRWRRSFLISFLFGAPVMICMIVFSLLKSRGIDPHVEVTKGLSLENLLYFMLCTPVQVSFL